MQSQQAKYLALSLARKAQHCRHGGRSLRNRSFLIDDVHHRDRVISRPGAGGFAAVGAESAQGDNEFAAPGASSSVSNSKDVGGEKAFAASGAHDKQTASRDEEL